jgi:hypothetical protein
VPHDNGGVVKEVGKNGSDGHDDDDVDTVFD